MVSTWTMQKHEGTTRKKSKTLGVPLRLLENNGHKPEKAKIRGHHSKKTKTLGAPLGIPKSSCYHSEKAKTQGYHSEFPLNK